MKVRIEQSGGRSSSDDVLRLRPIRVGDERLVELGDERMFDLEIDGGEDGLEGRHEAAFAEMLQDVAQGGFLAVLCSRNNAEYNEQDGIEMKR